VYPQFNLNRNNPKLQNTLATRRHTTNHKATQKDSLKNSLLHLVGFVVNFTTPKIVVTRIIYVKIVTL